MSRKSEKLLDKFQSKWPEINIFGKINKFNYTTTAILIAVLYLILYIPIMNDPFSYTTQIYINLLISIVFAISLNIVVGIMGQLSLGHAGFIAIGAYTAAEVSKVMVSMALPEVLQLIISTIIGGIVAAVFGALIAIPMLRLKGDYLAIITLAFGEIIKYVIQNIDFKFSIMGTKMEFLGGAAGLKNIPQIASFTSVFFIAIVSIVIMTMIMTSRHGRVILSIRENEIAAENIGININKVKIYGFALSSFFAGVGGSLLAHNLGILIPNDYGFLFSIQILVIVVFGGLGSITGSIISAVFLGVLNEILRDASQFRFLIYAIILILLMIFRPKGIFGTTEFTFSKLKFLRKKINRKLNKKGK